MKITNRIGKKLQQADDHENPKNKSSEKPNYLSVEQFKINHYQNVDIENQIHIRSSALKKPNSILNQLSKVDILTTK